MERPQFITGEQPDVICCRIIHNHKGILKPLSNGTAATGAKRKGPAKARGNVSGPSGFDGRAQNGTLGQVGDLVPLAGSGMIPVRQP